LKLGTTVDNVSDGTTYANTLFKDVVAKGATTIPAILKQLCLFPEDSDYPHGRMYMRNLGERLPYRGGSWYSTSYAGLPCLALSYERSDAYDFLGFALAYQA
jgi:hypothetical protein